MKIFYKKEVRQKIIITLVTVILFNFIVPMKRVEADSIMENILLEPITHFLASIADVVLNGLQYFLLEGSDQSLLWNLMYSKEEAPERLGVSDTSELYNKTIKRDHKADELEEGYSVPVIAYSPQEIFGNKIPALDINFINPSIKYADNKDVPKTSSAGVLQGVVNKWFIALRNIAVVGLLSVLVFIGLRMIISSSSQDKAKYKNMLWDWLVAMGLLFSIHIIMSFTLVITESITAAITNDNQGIEISVDGEKQVVTNLMGLVRFRVQYRELGGKATYLVLYFMLVIFTVMFTIQYLKRVLMMAFLTIISPVVALTYPIDKLADGSAQAFNKWLKEYVFNALLQPFHLLIYTVLLGSALDLAANNPIYAIVALAFLIPAEKLLRSIFGFDKAGVGTLGTLGAVAGGAAAMKGIDMVKNLAAGKKQSQESKLGGNSSSSDNSKIWTNDNINGYLNDVTSTSGNTIVGDADATSGNTTEGNTDATSGNTTEGNADTTSGNTTEGDADSTSGDNLNDDRLGNRILTTVKDKGRNIKNGIKGKGRDIKNGVKDIGQRHFTGKNLKKQGKRAIKFAAKAAVGAYGAAALGAVGLAAGATTGNLSDTIKYMGAAQMAGMTAGSVLAGKAGNLGAQIWDGGKDEHAKKMKRKEFLDNEDNRKYFRDNLNVKGKELNKVMQAAADYHEKGITNKDDILRGLQFEGSRNRSREQTINAMNMANKLSDDDLSNTEKREKFRQKLEQNLTNANYSGDAKQKSYEILEDVDIMKNGYIQYQRPGVNNPTGNNPTGNNPTGNNPTGNNPTENNPTGNNPTGNNPTGNNPTGNN